MTVKQILERLPRISVAVVGDICLDRWCYYDPAEAEPSRETGLERVAVVKTEMTPGAGGTVANNLAAMGVGKVSVIGATGDDGHGYELRQALAARRIEDRGLVTVPGIQTFTYTKLMRADTGAEDLPRVDFITNAPLSALAEGTIVECVRYAVHSHDVVIVADQAEHSHGGVVTPAIRELLSGLAKEQPWKAFIADSRTRIEKFHHLILKPNQEEAEAASRRLLGKVDYLELRRQTNARLLAVTHGSDGVLVVGEHSEEWVRTRRVEKPVDICGAGDSFCAGMAAALGAKATALEAVRFGNLAASVTIMKKGTGTAKPGELLDADAGN
jgi:rfaE bifunctional protein kinase chain/domain